MPRAQFRGGDRYRHPQAWIDHVVATDPALRRVRLTARPRYSSRLIYFGLAIFAHAGVPARTLIGRKSLVSQTELLDTIIHEELHHRLRSRAARGSRRARRRLATGQLEESYVEAGGYRFCRAHGRLL